MNFLRVRKIFIFGASIFLYKMKFLYEYWFCIYLRTRANTRADIVPVTLSALFRPQKTYFLLSEGSKSLIIMFFLFPELNSINNITMLKKLPDHFNSPYIYTKTVRFTTTVLVITESYLFESHI